MRMTGLSKYMVADTINRYGSLAQFESMIASGSEVPDAHATQSKRRLKLTQTQGARRYTDDQIRQAVAESMSIAEALRKLEIRAAGGNYATLHKQIQRLGLDVSHMTGMGWKGGQESKYIIERPLEEILVQNSDYANTSRLRKRLVTAGLLQPRCTSCGLTEWLAQPIPLELDHINGDRFDHRLENLRLLCPNCHALTATYRGKNKGR